MSENKTSIPPRDPSLPTKLYSGACHCGKFEYEFSHPAVEDGFDVVSCNCSICVQRGYLLIFIKDPQNDFRMKKGDIADLTKYKFNKGVIAHTFCPVCGCGVFGQAQSVIAVNLRSVAGIDLDTLKLKKYDGKSLL